MPIVFQWTTGNRGINMPIVGEQVAFWLDEGWQFGVILGGIYNQVDAPPSAPATSWHREFPDGTVLEYDPAGHTLKVDVQGSATVTTTGDATVEAGGTAKLQGASIVLQGDTQINGALTTSEGITATGAINSLMAVQKNGVPYTFP
jgi:phage baseplate assembly protein V